MTNLPESIRVEAEKVKSDFMAKLDYWQTPYSVGFDNALEWLYNFRVKELEESNEELKEKYDALCRKLSDGAHCIECLSNRTSLNESNYCEDCCEAERIREDG